MKTETRHKLSNIIWMLNSQAWIAYWITDWASGDNFDTNRHELLVLTALSSVMLVVWLWLSEVFRVR